MAMLKGRIAALVLLTAGWLAGCATAPSVVHDSPSIAQVQQAPMEFSGQSVVWGGTVLQVENKVDGSSRIRVLGSPLHRDGSPVRTDRTSGRFIVDVSEFADPAVYQTGRRITVSGRVSETLTDYIDQLQYTYPVIAADSHRLWPRRSAARTIPAWQLHDCLAMRSRDPFSDPWYYHRRAFCRQSGFWFHFSL